MRVVCIVSVYYLYVHLTRCLPHQDQARAKIRALVRANIYALSNDASRVWVVRRPTMHNFMRSVSSEIGLDAP